MSRARRERKLKRRVGGKSHAERRNFERAKQHDWKDKVEHERALFEQRACKCRACKSLYAPE